MRKKKKKRKRRGGKKRRMYWLQVLKKRRLRKKKRRARFKSFKYRRSWKKRKLPFFVRLKIFRRRFKKLKVRKILASLSSLNYDKTFISAPKYIKRVYKLCRNYGGYALPFLDRFLLNFANSNSYKIKTFLPNSNTNLAKAFKINRRFLLLIKKFYFYRKKLLTQGPSFGLKYFLNKKYFFLIFKRVYNYERRSLILLKGRKIFRFKLRLTYRVLNKLKRRVFIHKVKKRKAFFNFKKAKALLKLKSHSSFENVSFPSRYSRKKKI